MRRLPSIERGDRVSAGAALGAEHPLTRAAATLASVTNQSMAVGAAFVGSVIARSQGQAWATAIAASAAIVLLGLGFVAITLVQRKRERALDLILEGRERLPIAAVQRQRRRLVALRTRRRLARALEGVIQDGSTPSIPPAGNRRPLYDMRMVKSADPDLRGVITTLRTTKVAARGVARAERLLTDPRSPLHGHDPEALREEVRQVGRLLEAPLTIGVD